MSLFFVLSFIAYGIFSFDCNFRVSSLLCFAGPRFKSFHFCSLLVLVFHLISLSCLSMSFVSFAFSFCLIAFAQWLVILSWPCSCLIVVFISTASLCFALLHIASLRFTLFLLIVEDLEIKFFVCKFKARKGCDYTTVWTNGSWPLVTFFNSIELSSLQLYYINFFFTTYFCRGSWFCKKRWT